jgi:hypothetical protein
MRYLLLMCEIGVFTAVCGQKNQQDALVVEYKTIWNESEFKFRLLPANRFELIMTPRCVDCPVDTFLYGMGYYLKENDRDMCFDFDSIPHVKSSHRIDSFPKLSGPSQLFFSVYNENMQPLDSVLMSTGPRLMKKNKKSSFIRQYFNHMLFLEFDQHVTYFEFSRKGYYSEVIDNNKFKIHNYKIQVQLRPKPKVRAYQYFPKHQTFAKISVDGSIDWGGIVFEKVKTP